MRGRGRGRGRGREREEVKGIPDIERLSSLLLPCLDRGYNYIPQALCPF